MIKLSQGEFVATARLETIFSASPDIQCIFVFGRSEWSHLLAVAVPSQDVSERCNGDAAVIKKAVSAELRRLAKQSELRSYELPRDFLLEPEPFTQSNGLLSDHGKPLWPILREKYAHRLDALNDQLMAAELTELREIHSRVQEQPVLDTLMQAVRSLVGGSADEIDPRAQFRDLGGDSLTAVSLASMLSEAYGISVPVGHAHQPSL